MNTRFVSLNLLFAFGLAGCGSEAPDKEAAVRHSAEPSNASTVVLTPPSRPGGEAKYGLTQENQPGQAVPVQLEAKPGTIAPSKPKPTPEPVAGIASKPSVASEKVDQSKQEDSTPKRNIFRSAGSGDLDTVKYHLANGVNVNAQDGSGKTALLWAVRSQKHAVVSHLLARGANPNLADDSQLTPLFWAVRIRRPELVSQLLANGADITLKEKNGRTALDYAKDETVQAILRKHSSQKE